MATVRVEVDEQAILKLLARPDVEAALAEKAEQIAAAARSAGIMVEGIPGDVPLPVEINVENDGRVAKATVAINHPAGIAVEMKHRLLVRSVDAAR